MVDDLKSIVLSVLHAIINKPGDLVNVRANMDTV